jgi:hypothetical protein
MLPVFVTASILHEGVTHDVVVDQSLEVSVGDKIDLRVPRQDSAAVYSLEGLPIDAVAKADADGILVHWEPIDADVGTHRVRVDVHQGDEGYVKTVRFVVNEHGQQLFVPGAISTLYVPNDTGNLGAFIGGGIELVFFFYASQGNMWVPSHGRFYLTAVVLASTQPGIDPLFSGAVGFDLSLERTPNRRFLLPYVGIQSGVAFQQQVGTFGWAMPLAGVYPWASRSLRISVQGGYLLPTTAAQNIRGVVVTASLDVAPW